MDQRRVPCQETKCGLQLCYLIGQMPPAFPLIGQYIELCQCANLSQKAPLQHSYISTFIFGPFLILDTGLAWIVSCPDIYPYLCVLGAFMSENVFWNIILQGDKSLV